MSKTADFSCAQWLFGIRLHVIADVRHRQQYLRNFGHHETHGVRFYLDIQAAHYFEDRLLGMVPPSRYRNSGTALAIRH